MRETYRPRLVAGVVSIPIFVAFALAMFAWPSANLAPRDLPLGLVGPAAARSQLAGHLQMAGASSFDFHIYADEGSARRAIKDRAIYGAIVVSPAGTTLLIASAASPAVAQLLTQAMTAGTAGPRTQPARVVDVVPAPSNDARGAALGAAVLPLVLAGVIAALLITVLSYPGIAQATALVLAACLAGLVADGTAQGWLGVIAGNWLANAGVFAFTILAIASTVAGLGAVLGRAGLVLGALLMVFVGNPFSAVTAAPELLPRPVGLIGQLLPPGAGGNLLRSTAFFDGNGAAGHIVVLAAWTLFGFASLAAGAVRRPRETSEAPLLALAAG